jgi:hypothetical protein
MHQWIIQLDSGGRDPPPDPPVTMPGWGLLAESTSPASGFTPSIL